MNKKMKYAVVIAGCGRMDGSEIHEATTLLLAISQNGHEYQCFSPNHQQPKVFNNLSGEELNETRNMMIEAARIARGEIKDIKTYHPQEFDGLLFPGGLGAVRNLCDYATKGVECTVDPDVHHAIQTTYEAKKPIGAMCIAPVVVAKALGKYGVKITLGDDVVHQSDVENIKKMGALHENCQANGICVDEKHKIVTTPAYMLCKKISEVYEGANNLIQKIESII